MCAFTSGHHCTFKRGALAFLLLRNEALGRWWIYTSKSQISRMYRLYTSKEWVTFSQSWNSQQIPSPYVVFFKKKNQFKFVINIPREGIFFSNAACNFSYIYSTVTHTAWRWVWPSETIAVWSSSAECFLLKTKLEPIVCTRNKTTFISKMTLY